MRSIYSLAHKLREEAVRYKIPDEPNIFVRVVIVLVTRPPVAEKKKVSHGGTAQKYLIISLLE